ncbi:MAG: nucleoside triphosphate pyrophosphohydrolase [Nitrospiraceae bacterium]|nr:nucleoside triphosphate pyrophosphohydrolase [Nitrospiraceae bacterium]
MNPDHARSEAFLRLLGLMARLREENGCPWDRKQTPASLKPFLIEECFEVIDAIDEGSPPKIREELGDLLFQIVFHARIAEEQGEFDIADVLTTIREKMVRRHPHVFGTAQAATDREVLANWEEIKKREKGGEPQSVLEGVPKTLPSLLRAHKIQERAARVGFDWNHLNEVLPKLDEEISEFKASLAEQNAEKIEEELGDLFFTLVNVARFVDVDPEQALRKTISKFVRRFRIIEERAAGVGKSLKDMTLDEMEKIWQESKQDEA